ncbi:MAG: exodeoxyribonuclease VII small subunit [Candidatus Nitrospinota bacterium M3_3B_026]
MAEKEKPEKEMKFEAALKRLEEIVGKLEDGDLELEKSIELFEEGIKMAKTCQKKLDEAEKKIEKLVKERGGELGAEPLEEIGEEDAPF